MNRVARDFRTKNIAILIHTIFSQSIILDRQWQSFIIHEQKTHKTVATLLDKPHIAVYFIFATLNRHIIWHEDIMQNCSFYAYTGLYACRRSGFVVKREHCRIVEVVLFLKRHMITKKMSFIISIHHFHMSVFTI